MGIIRALWHIFKAVVRRLVCLFKGHAWEQNGTRYVTVTRFIYNDDTGLVDRVPKPVEVTRFSCSRCPKEQHSDPVPNRRDRGY